MRVPGGGAACLGVGRPGSGALPPPTARPLGGLPGPTTHWLWVRGGAGVGTRHQPHRARSCKLALRCGGGTRAAGGGASCLGVGRPGSGARPPPTTRLIGRAAGAHFPLAVAAVCGRGGPAVLGTLSRAAVRRVLCALPGFPASGGRCGLAPVLVPPSWPAACLFGVPRGPALVRRFLSGPVALGALVGFLVAVVPSPTSGAVAPGFTGWLRGARGGQPRTGLIVPAAGPCGGKGAERAPRRTRSGPRDGVVPGGSLRLRSWAACAAVVWRVWTRSLTRPVSRTVRLATGDSAGAPGLFGVDANTAPFASENATPGSRGCVRVHDLLGRVGRAGLLGAFWCASPFLWPFLVCSLLVQPPPGWGCHVCGCCWVFWFYLLLFPFSPSLCPRCVLLCVFSGPGCPGPWRPVPPPLFFPSPPSVRPVVSCFACFPAWGALGLGILLPPPPPPLFFCPPLPVVSGVSCFPVALGLCAPPPPPRFFFFVPFSFFSLLFLPVVRCGAGLCVLRRRVCLAGAVPVVALCALAGVVWCWPLGRAVLCCLVVGLGVVLCWCCPCLATWLAALWFGVVCLGVPLPYVVFCCAVLSCGGVLSCSGVCLRRCLCLLFVSCRCASAVCVLGCHAVYSLSCPFVVLCASYVLFLVAGVVGS